MPHQKDLRNDAYIRSNVEEQLDGSEKEPLQPNCEQYNWKALLAQGVVVATFVFFNSSHALVSRISISADGEVPYNTGAAVACSEFIKLLFSSCFLLLMNYHDLAWPWPHAWKVEFAYLGSVAALFAVQNQLNFFVIANLGPTLFAILGNLKIVWTCVFMRVLMDKRFLWLQWVAVSLLVLSSLVLETPFSSPNSSQGRSPARGLVLILISTVCSGLASVQNEIILKRGEGAQNEAAEMPFMLKNASLYLWGLGLNLLTWALGRGDERFFAGFNVGAVGAVIALVGIGLSLAFLLKYLDNMARCFASVVAVFSTLLLSRLLPEQYRDDPFSAKHLAALAMLSIALAIYYSPHSSRNVWFLAFTAGISGLGVGCLCMLLDQLLYMRHG